jgi:hypothetical protein
MQGQVKSRQEARLEAGRAGACLTLWRGADLRGALWAARNPRRQSVCEAPRAGVVRLSCLSPAALAIMRERSVVAVTGARPRRDDAVRDAWVRLVQERMSGRSVCFFTGTYRDDYGFPMGLMKARNVQRDFKRFLVETGFDDAEWVCAVEAHRYRVILHLHALLAGVSPEQGDALKHHWDTTRGWSTAPACNDGGMAYTCKYALKAAEGDAFDWSW